jgi:uncharacterized protein GlcG (DUF336 family)
MYANRYKLRLLRVAAAMAVTVVISGGPVVAGDDEGKGSSQSCAGLPSHAKLEAALKAVVDGGGNTGLGNQMWGTVVNRDGLVCAVAFTGGDRGDQWPGSRVISAQKAYTANAFSLPSDAGFGSALSTGNLYGTVLEQGSLLGLQFSNPVDAESAYAGDAENFGKANDPMMGRRVGGVNVFGGGLALYDKDKNVLGGIGVSGDTSCTDHVIAWKVRDSLRLDYVPGGVSPTGDDNLKIATPVTAGAFEHPDCGGGVAAIIKDLPTNFPIGPNR